MIKVITMSEPSNLEETFSFQILDDEIEYQGEAVIDLAVNLDLIEGIGEENPFEYPDFILIRDYITDFLVDYPNETDFWEILNKNLVTDLLLNTEATDLGATDFAFASILIEPKNYRYCKFLASDAIEIAFVV